MIQFQTREEWLMALTEELRTDFVEAGYPLPQDIRVAIGFTSVGRRGKRIGECWSDSASGDGSHEIFIVPTMDDQLRIADVLVHELVHAAVGCGAGHGPKFRKAALAVGLTGRMKATVATPELVGRLKEIIEEIGDLPHAKLNSGVTTEKKQTTRMMKASCEHCGFTVRVAAKWVKDVGAPCCPVHGAMQVAGVTTDEDAVLELQAAA